MTTNTLAPLSHNASLAEWQACATTWIERKFARSESHRTKAIYERTLTAFFQHCQKHPADSLPADVLAFATSPNMEDGNPLAKATVNHRIAVVSSFYAFAWAKHLIT